MSTRSEIHAKVAKEGLTPDSVRELALAADELFSSSPSLASFAALSLFRYLSTHWEGGQAMSESAFQKIEQQLAPKVAEWLGTDANFASPPVLADVITILHRSVARP